MLNLTRPLPLPLTQAACSSAMGKKRKGKAVGGGGGASTPAIKGSEHKSVPDRSEPGCGAGCSPSCGRCPFAMRLRCQSDCPPLLPLCADLTGTCLSKRLPSFRRNTPSSSTSSVSSAGLLYVRPIPSSAWTHRPSCSRGYTMDRYTMRGSPTRDGECIQGAQGVNW